MQFDILTIFPEILSSYTNESILKIAQKKNLIKINTHNIRDFSKDKHKSVDDKPYGGGPGMLMMVEPIYECLKSIKRKKKMRVLLMDPGGNQFDQKQAQKYSKYDQLIFVCGRYEGIDERAHKFIDEKVSVGPYVLSGGELPALIITEAVARLIPGVLGHEHATEDETFSPDKDYIEYPQFTRPEVFEVEGKEMKVPKVLLSGHHKKISDWRKARVNRKV